jgi:hypothetical protein
MTEPKQGLHMIDPVQYGQLLARVEALTDQLDRVTTRLEAIEDRFKAGRGVIVGLFVAAGLAMYGVKGMLERWFA